MCVCVCVCVFPPLARPLARLSVSPSMLLCVFLSLSSSLSRSSPAVKTTPAWHPISLKLCVRACAEKERARAHSCTHTTVFAIILRRRSHPVKVVEVLQRRFLLHTSVCVRMYAHRQTDRQTDTSSFPTCMCVSMQGCVCTITSVNLNVHMRGCRKVRTCVCMYVDQHSYVYAYKLSQIYAFGARGVSAQYECACVQLYAH